MGCFGRSTPYFHLTAPVRTARRNRRFVLTVNYNFKTGKSFKARKVESGAGDEKGRM